MNISQLRKTFGQFSGKVKKIAIAVMIACGLVCCFCLFVLLSGSPKSTKPTPTQEFNIMLTQAYQTAFASLPTNAPMSSPTKGQSYTPKQACIPNNNPQFGRVVEVVDGDTIKVLVDGVVYSVRYIGIDTPEMTIPIKYFGKEASIKNSEYVSGKDVVLFKDVSETDKYDRLLRYVFVGDTFVNYELVNQGYATTLYYPPDVSCAALFKEAENYAKSQMLGLWVEQKTQPTQSPTSKTMVIVSVNKYAEYVDIRNDANTIIDLKGWVLISEKGNQSCTLSGVIQPSEVLRIWAGSGQTGFSCNFSKNIWNNSELDPAVLYNPQYQEVDRYP